MLDELGMFARFVWGLHGFLRQPIDLNDARLQIKRQLDARADTFLRILQRGIYEQPASPYLRLLRWARIEFDEIAQMARRQGVEHALEHLHASGVYVTLDEFKGRKPIVRGSDLSFAIEPKDFDNPLRSKHYEVTSGGSRSAGTRIVVDLDLLAYEAAYHLIYQSAFGVVGRPMAIWRPLPPGSAGMKNSLYQLKTGQRLRQWFHQNRRSIDRRSVKYAAFAAATVYGSRMMGRALPVPIFVPPDRALVIARWLAEMKRRGTPALLDCSCSSAVRACLAATRHRLDIADTFFRVGGEPFTPAKARAIAAAGRGRRRTIRCPKSAASALDARRRGRWTICTSCWTNSHSSSASAARSPAHR